MTDRNIWTQEPYVYRATSSGVDIYNINTEMRIAAADYTDGINSVWANDTYLYIATSNSGILWLPVSSVSGTYDLTNQLSIYRGYPNITDNDVTYLHGNGNYLCVTTAAGVDNINLTTNSGIYTTISGANKCHQAADGTFYYIKNKLRVMYNNTSNWTSPDYTYPSGGIIPADITINDIYIADGTPNILLIATSSGVVVIEEQQGNESNSRFKHFYKEVV